MDEYGPTKLSLYNCDISTIPYLNHTNYGLHYFTMRFCRNLEDFMQNLPMGRVITIENCNIEDKDLIEYFGADISHNYSIIDALILNNNNLEMSDPMCIKIMKDLRIEYISVAGNPIKSLEWVPDNIVELTGINFEADVLREFITKKNLKNDLRIEN